MSCRIEVILASCLPSAMACAPASEPPLVAPSPPKEATVVDAGTPTSPITDASVEAPVTQALAAYGEPVDAAAVGNDGGTSGHLKLSAETIRAVVIAHRGALQKCHDAESSRDRPLKGGVTVHWTIDRSGAVAERNVVESTLGNASIEACLLREVGSWSFPQSDGTSAVTFPFTFGYDPASTSVSASAPQSAVVQTSARAEGWSACPFPRQADAAEVDSGLVVLQVVVAPDGSPESVTVLNDSGHGFGDAARGCALKARYLPALDASGHPVRGTTRPFRVHFSR